MLVTVILAVLLLVALSVVVVVVWVTTAAFKFVTRLVNGPGDQVDGGRPRCRNAGCRAGNPPHAKFCRRCGTLMTHPAAVAGVYRRPPVGVAVSA